MRLLGLAPALLAVSALASDVPTERGVTLLLKVVTYDTHFDATTREAFVVLIPFERDRAEADAALAELGSLSRTTLKGRPLRFQVVSAEQLEPQAAQASAILALPGCGPALLVEIARVAQKSRRYSLGLSALAVEQYVGLGVLESASGKPEIVINVPRATAAGAEFPPAVLKVARLVK